ncbi:hypothetical protein P5P81_00590 [Tritonibacter mobilis]|nr:hypothetical protein [Tritonibacter mobilis]
MELGTLTDGAADFSTGMVDRSSGSLSYLPNQTAVTPDWTNQEIASFMRAHRLLAIAGLSLETERGVTDEGDPWFVFVNQDGDVFAHFARIGEVYILDSIIQQEIAKAGSLDELISAFAETTTPVDSADHTSTSATVVPFVALRETKVRLHPGATLAALIWTIYIQSGELAVPSFSAALDVTATSEADEVTALPSQIRVTPSEELATNTSEDNSADLKSTEKDTHTQAPSSAQVAATFTTVQTVGMGLSAIAISNGMYFWVSGESLLEQATLASQLVAEVIKDISDEETEQLADLSELDSILSTVRAAIEGNSEAMALAQSPKQDIPTVDLASMPDSVANAVENGKVGSAIKTKNVQGDVAFSEEIDGELIKFRDIQANRPEETEASQIGSTPVDIEKRYVLQELDEVEYFSLTSDAFSNIATQLSDLPFFAQMLSSSFQAVVASEGSQTVPTPASGPDTVNAASETAARFSIFNDDAHSFIVFLMSKGDETKRSDYDNEVVLFDFDAIDSQTDAIYARSWSFEDGSVISAVGLKSDFAAFDLVI